MRPNIVKQLWKENKAAVGSWLNLGNPLAAELMGHLGFDWIAVDAEHSSVDMETVKDIFVSLSTTNTVPMIRLAWNDPVLIKRALDAGAYGVIIPMVNSREEAIAAVKACKYPPVGTRSMGFGRADLYAGKDYKAHANEEIAVIVQIEHIDAVNNIDEILSVEGIDAFFIGPGDLAASMGLPVVLGENKDPQFQEAVKKIIAAGKRHNVPAGMHVAKAEEVNQKIQDGFKFLALGTDTFFLTMAARTALGQVTADRQAG